MKFVVLFFLLFSLVSCTTVVPKDSCPCLPKPEASPSPTPSPTPIDSAKATHLDWEKTDASRIVWSATLENLLSDAFPSFDKAKDAVFFCPKYKELSRAQKLFMFETMIVWVSYFESGWDPGNASVDVGTAGDRDTWSVGLMQMSVIDQESYGFLYGYKYNDLLDPLKNLRLAISIMGKQVDKYGKLLIPKGESGVYWATISPGRRDDQSDAVAKHTRALGFCN